MKKTRNVKKKERKLIRIRNIAIESGIGPDLTDLDLDHVDRDLVLGKDGNLSRSRRANWIESRIAIEIEKRSLIHGPGPGIS